MRVVVNFTSVTASLSLLVCIRRDVVIIINNSYKVLFSNQRPEVAWILYSIPFPRWLVANVCDTDTLTDGCQNCLVEVLSYDIQCGQKVRCACVSVVTVCDNSDCISQTFSIFDVEGGGGGAKEWWVSLDSG